MVVTMANSVTYCNGKWCDITNMGNRNVVSYDEAYTIDNAMLVQDVAARSIYYDVTSFAITLYHLPFAIADNHSETLNCLALVTHNCVTSPEWCVNHWLVPRSQAEQDQR